MKVSNRFLGDAFELETPRFGDERGWFSVPFEAAQAIELGLTEPFVQDNHSLSVDVGTVRGLHFQLAPYAQGKLVRVAAGRVLDVIVDLRPDSRTLGEWAGIELSADAGNQLWVPRGFGHGFCTLEPNTHLLYKVDNVYNKDADRSLAFDDTSIDIDWPIDHGDMTLSDKDAAAADFDTIMREIKETQ